MTKRIDDARERLDIIARKVADTIDAGENDPTYHDFQELESAAIDLGHALAGRAKRRPGS